MASPSSPPAGGILIALGAIIGVGIGFVEQQVTAGFLIGTGLGTAAALALWWRHRA